jgi:hypothetical protein
LSKKKKTVVRVKDGKFTDGVRTWGGRRRLITDEEIAQLDLESSMDEVELVVLRLRKLHERLSNLLSPYKSLLTDHETLSNLRDWRRQGSRSRDQLAAQIPDGLLSAVDAIQGTVHLMNSLQRAVDLS